MKIAKTSMVCFDNGADTGALLEDTVFHTLLHDLVKSALPLPQIYIDTDTEDEDEYRSGGWSELLPGPDNTHYDFRLDYGWSEPEIVEILQLCNAALTEFDRRIALQPKGLARLTKGREVLHSSVIPRWEALLNEARNV
jgi:hypothetical protein